MRYLWLLLICKTYALTILAGNISCNITVPPSQPKQPILVAVHSSADHFYERQIIRKTWFTYPGARYIFVVGRHDKISEEQEVYNDLLILPDMSESYLSTNSILPFKTAALLWYAVDQKYDYVVKADDDTFINIPHLQNIIKSIPDIPFYGGHILRTAMPIIDVNNKWYSDWEEEFYPPYCAL